MRHEDAALALWLATDPASGDQPAPCWEGPLDGAPATVPIRRRAGAAIIAIGEWLAGEPRPQPVRVARRRPLAGQPY